VHDETGIGSRVQAGERVDTCRCVDAFMEQSDDARSTGSGRCDDSNPSQRSVSKRTEEQGSAESVDSERHHAGTEYRVVDGQKEMRAFF